jgi:hypothetical protein
LREHSADGQLDRLALTEVRRLVHHLDLVTIVFRHLEPGQSVRLSGHDDDHAGLVVGTAHSLHGVSEVLDVPPVSKEVDVVAHSLPLAVSLQCVAARKSDSILAEAPQPDSGQSVLQFIHALRRRHQFRVTLLPATAHPPLPQAPPHITQGPPMAYRHTSPVQGRFPQHPFVDDSAVGVLT